jgi:hypothetical protein
MYQNLIQQTNALESLADMLIGADSVGCKRNRRDFVEMYAALLQSLGRAELLPQERSGCSPEL